MGKLDIKQSIEINVAAEKVWVIVADGFLDVSKWATGVTTSINNPAIETSFEGAPAGGRICEVDGFGKADEQIRVFEPSKGKITWSADIEKAPGFLKNLQNAITIESLGENSSRFTTNLTGDAKGLMGVLMGGMLRKNFNKALIAFTKDTKVYAETGTARKDGKKEASA